MVSTSGRKPVINKGPENQVGVEVTFYTDPLCCWSWAMWPQWERLLAEMDLPAGQIKYKMGGLLPSWRHFDDPVNSIRKPSQMGPEWLHAKALSGQPINDKIWITDPPASSFPACIAVKCVELQSGALAGQYLHDLQCAVMEQGENIAKTSVLLETAVHLSATCSSFNVFEFRENLLGDAGKIAFRKDLQECKYLNISRLPTVLFRASSRRSILLTGYQAYEPLRAAWDEIRIVSDSGKDSSVQKRLDLSK